MSKISEPKDKLKIVTAAAARRRLACYALCAGAYLSCITPELHADILNWSTNLPIPGTSGITPAPGIDLSGWNTAGHELEFASLSVVDLHGSTFAGSDLASAEFSFAHLNSCNLMGTNLTGALLSGANLSFANASSATFTNGNLTTANLASAILTGADFTSAVIGGANFDASGLTLAQLATTASYQAHTLQNITFNNNDFTGGAFGGQNLLQTSFRSVILTGADFTNASMHGVTLRSATLTNANFAGADVSGANLFLANLSGANFTGASIVQSFFGSATGFTQQQLQSTASYQAHDLHGVGFDNDDLTGWDLSGQNLTQSDMTSANLTAANLEGADLTSATVESTNFTLADLRGVTGFAPTGTTITSNAILPDGSVPAMHLTSGQTLLVRNYTVPVTISDPAAQIDAGATLQINGSQVTVSGPIAINGALNIANPLNTTVFSGNMTGTGAISVGAGSAVTWNAAGAITVSPAISGAGGVSQTGPGTVTVAGTYSATGPVNVSVGKLVFASTAAPRQTSGVLLNMQSLSITGPGAILDSTNHDLLIGNGNLSQVETELLDGLGFNGTNNTPAIVSSALGSDKYLVPVSASVFGGVGGTIDGTTITQPNSIVVKYTYKGDVNLDGKVTTADYLVLNGNFGKTTPGLADMATALRMGDVNLDGKVSTADYLVLNGNFGKGTTAGNPLLSVGGSTVTAVPEPGCLGLLGMGGAALLLRRRRRAP